MTDIVYHGSVTELFNVSIFSVSLVSQSSPTCVEVELAYETMYIYHLLVITHCLGDTMTGLAGVDHSNLLCLMHTHTHTLCSSGSMLIFMHTRHPPT